MNPGDVHVIRRLRVFCWLTALPIAAADAHAPLARELPERTPVMPSHLRFAVVQHVPRVPVYTARPVRRCPVGNLLGE